MAIYLGCMLPYTSSDSVKKPSGQLCVVFSSCFEWGLQSLDCHQPSGGLLPHLSILTNKLAVYFCCTFLKVTLTGSYPAPCPMKPGLSSWYCYPATIWLSNACIIQPKVLFVNVAKMFL